MTDELMKLDDVCGLLFGLKPVIARRKAALGQLPVPAFRLNDARKGPFLLRKSDVDALVERRAGAATALHSKMSGVTKAAA
jgi:hypothetical protein